MMQVVESRRKVDKSRNIYLNNLEESTYRTLDATRSHVVENIIITETSRHQSIEDPVDKVLATSVSTKRKADDLKSDKDGQECCNLDSSGNDNKYDSISLEWEFDSAETTTDTDIAGWEFDHSPPTWLTKVIKEHKAMTSSIENSENLLWWRIIDLSSAMKPMTLSPSDQEAAHAFVHSALRIGQEDEWTVLQPPIERCLKSLAKLTAKQLKKVAKLVEPMGTSGAILQIRRMVTSSREEDTDPLVVQDNPNSQDHETFLVNEDDYRDDNVAYILNLLRFSYELIALRIPSRENSERDIDIFIISHIFSCLNGVLDRHYGEIVSRASRDRRMSAVDAPFNSEGYHVDWLFTRHDLAKDLTWGREFSLCERAGSRIENKTKSENDSLRVHKTLKDMHRSLIGAITIAGGGTISRDVLATTPGLLMPGFLTSRFSIRVILVMYVGAGFYLSADLASFDIPLASDELKGVLKMARTMLQVKRILCSTVSNFAQMVERAENERFSLGKVSLPARLQEFKSPKKLKKKRTIDGNLTQLTLLIVEVNGSSIRLLEIL